MSQSRSKGFLTESCHATRSMPVTISVTGCLRSVKIGGSAYSTWSRVFLRSAPKSLTTTYISIKKYSPVSASIINSTVPAPTLIIRSDHHDISLVHCFGSGYRFCSHIGFHLEAETWCRSLFDDFCSLVASGNIQLTLMSSLD